MLHIHGRTHVRTKLVDISSPTGGAAGIKKLLYPDNRSRYYDSSSLPPLTTLGGVTVHRIPKILRDFNKTAWKSRPRYKEEVIKF